MSHRTLIDTIVRSATVELFQALSIAVAPISGGQSDDAIRLPDVAASIEFSAPGFAGTLYLCCPWTLVPKHDQKVRAPTAEDWVRELTNQLLGRIKIRLMQSDIDLKAGLPKTCNSELLQRRFGQRDNARFYEFRTLRGDVVLIAEGVLRDSILDYSHAITNVREGDIILFESEKRRD